MSLGYTVYFAALLACSILGGVQFAARLHPQKEARL